MTEDNFNRKQEEKWQSYLRRRRFGKILLKIGAIVIVVSFFLGFFPVAVAAFTGIVYVPNQWDGYFILGIIFGLFLLLAGIIARISPNMMDGDALWIMKMGPYGKGI